MNVLTHCHNCRQNLVLVIVLTSYIKYLIVIISCDITHKSCYSFISNFLGEKHGHIRVVGGGGGMVLRRGIPSPTYPIPLPYETLHAHLYGIPLFVAAVMGMEKEFLSMGV